MDRLLTAADIAELLSVPRRRYIVENGWAGLVLLRVVEMNVCFPPLPCVGSDS